MNPVILFPKWPNGTGQVRYRWLSTKVIHPMGLSVSVHNYDDKHPTVSYRTGVEHGRPGVVGTEVSKRDMYDPTTLSPKRPKQLLESVVDAAAQHTVMRGPYWNPDLAPDQLEMLMEEVRARTLTAYRSGIDLSEVAKLADTFHNPRARLQQERGIERRQADRELGWVKGTESIGELPKTFVIMLGGRTMPIAQHP